MAGKRIAQARAQALVEPKRAARVGRSAALRAAALGGDVPDEEEVWSAPTEPGPAAMVASGIRPAGGDPFGPVRVAGQNEMPRSRLVEYYPTGGRSWTKDAGAGPGVYTVPGQPELVELLNDRGTSTRMNADAFFKSGLAKPYLAEPREPSAEDVAAAEDFAALRRTLARKLGRQVAPEEAEQMLAALGGGGGAQRRMTMGGPTAKIASPGQFQSLLTAAPGQEGTLEESEQPAPRAPDSGGAMGAIQKLAMNGTSGEDLQGTDEPIEAVDPIGEWARTASPQARQALPRVDQALRFGKVTPEGIQVLAALTRDPVMKEIGGLVAAAAERARKAGLDEREIALKERPKYTPEELDWKKQELANDTARALAAMFGALKPNEMNDWRANQAKQRLLEKLAQQSDKAPFADMLDAFRVLEEVAPGVSFGTTPDEIPATSITERALRGVGLAGWMGPKEAEARQALGNLRDLIKRARSGAAITAKEEADYLRLMGDQALASPQAMSSALTQFRRGIGNRLAGLQSPYKKVLDQYEGPKAADFLARPARKGGGTAQTATAPAEGMIRVTNGEEVMDIPAADEAEAAQDGFRRL